MTCASSGIRQIGFVVVVGCAIAASGTALAQPPKSVPPEPAGGDAKAMAKPVPFKLARPDKPLIIVETMVNDKGPFRFVLDTGAGLTIVSPELANKLDIERAERKKATGAGGSVEIHHGMVKSLKVGETRLEELKVGIMDLRGISRACGTNLDGIIGYNFLGKFRVSIDYPKKIVTFE